MGESPDVGPKLCTYILDIVSGNGRVATINRPLGYNYDIQPFLPCSVLRGGRENMTDKLRRRAFRSMVAKRTDWNLGRGTRAARRGAGLPEEKSFVRRVSMILASPFFPVGYSRP